MHLLRKEIHDPMATGTEPGEREREWGNLFSPAVAFSSRAIFLAPARRQAIDIPLGLEVRDAAFESLQSVVTTSQDSASWYIR